MNEKKQPCSQRVPTIRSLLQCHLIRVKPQSSVQVDDEIDLNHIRNELLPAAGVDPNGVHVIHTVFMPKRGEHPCLDLESVHGLQELVKEDVECGLPKSPINITIS